MEPPQLPVKQDVDQANSAPGPGARGQATVVDDHVHFAAGDRLVLVRWGDETNHIPDVGNTKGRPQ
jgi:hypothetical protein